MEKTILTDALGSCPSLKGLVAAILRTDTYIRGELVSASCEGGALPGRVRLSFRGAGPRALSRRREQPFRAPFPYLYPLSR